MRRSPPAVSRGVSPPFKSATRRDAAGNYASPVTADADGYSSCYVGARSYSVWVPN